MDAVDRLLAACLELPEDSWQAAVDRACDDHPEHAAELRRRFSALDALVPAGEPALPERLGGHRLLQRIGSGGMGVVYRAEDEQLGRTVALKVVRADLLHFPGARARLAREVRAIARLRHPGIVPVFAVGDAEGVPFYTMEWIAGCSLADAIGALRHRRPETLTGSDLGAVLQAHLEASGDRQVLAAALFDEPWETTCLRLAEQLAAALHHAHQAGVVHRDVKPSNVLLAADGRARLIDFGLAWRDDGSDLTRSGGALGTAAYMAPEQALSAAAVDGRADVYSLGVTLYEMLTLQRPFAELTPTAIPAAAAQGRVVPLRQLHRRLRWETVVICAKAMEPDRDRRYRSAAAFADDLRAALAHRPIRARAPSPWRRGVRFAQRHPGWTAAAAVLLPVCVVLPTALLVQERRASAALAREAALTERALTSLEQVFAGANPFAGGAPDTPARELLRRGERLLARAADQPAVRARIATAVGSAYRNLGLHAAAEPLLRDALAAYERTGAATRAGDAANSLALLLAWTDRHAEAEALFRRALASRVESDGAESPAAARIALNLVRLLTATDRRADAAVLLRQIDAAIAAGKPAANDADLVAQVHAEAGRLHMLEDRPEDALADFDRAWQVAAALGDEAAWLRGKILVDRSVALATLGNHDGATAAVDEGTAILAAAFGEQHGMTAQARAEQVRERWRAGHLLDAEQLALRRLEAAPGDCSVLLLLGRIRLDRNDAAGAIEPLRTAAEASATPAEVRGAAARTLAEALLRTGQRAAALARLRSLPADAALDSAEELVNRSWLAMTLAEVGEFDECRSIVRAVEAGLGTAAGPRLMALQAAAIHDRLSYALLLLREPAAAETHGLAALAALERSARASPDLVGLATAHVAWAREQQGDAGAAEAGYRTALAHIERGGRAHRFDASFTYEALGNLLWQRRAVGEAEPMFARAFAIREAAVGLGNPLTRRTGLAWARSLAAKGDAAAAAKLAARLLAAAASDDPDRAELDELCRRGGTGG